MGVDEICHQFLVVKGLVAAQLNDRPKEVPLYQRTYRSVYMKTVTALQHHKPKGVVYTKRFHVRLHAFGMFVLAVFLSVVNDLRIKAFYLCEFARTIASA